MRYFFFRAKDFSFIPILFFIVSFVKWWLRLSSDAHKTTLINLKVGSFYLFFIFVQLISISKRMDQIKPASVSETVHFNGRHKNGRYKQKTSSDQRAHIYD